MANDKRCFIFISGLGLLRAKTSIDTHLAAINLSLLLNLYSTEFLRHHDVQLCLKNWRRIIRENKVDLVRMIKLYPVSNTKNIEVDF